MLAEICKRKENIFSSISKIQNSKTTFKNPKDQKPLLDLL